MCGYSAPRRCVFLGRSESRLCEEFLRHVYVGGRKVEWNFRFARGCVNMREI